MARSIRFPAFGLPKRASIRGRAGYGPAAFRHLLERPEVLALLREIDDLDGTLMLEEGVFTVRLFSGAGELDALAREVAQTFQRVMMAPWEALREKGLAQPGISDWWTGEVDGVPVQLRPIGTHEDRLAWGMQLEASLPDPLPPGTLVTHKDLGAEIGADRFRDLMLASMLDLVSDDPEEVDRRLAVEGIRESVLELVHGVPGSRLLTTHLELVHRAPVGEPGPWVDRAVALVNALRR